MRDCVVCCDGAQPATGTLSAFGPGATKEDGKLDSRKLSFVVGAQNKQLFDRAIAAREETRDLLSRTGVVVKQINGTRR